MNILFAMQDTDFVEFNGCRLVSSYLRDPGEALVPDDVVLEAENEDGELMLTFHDVDGADQIGPGQYRLRSGAVVVFLRQPTIH